MTAVTAQNQNDQPASDQREVPLPLRSDTFLGVCEAIGQDFGFSPNWLRVAFAPLIIMSPVTAVGAYLTLGCFVGVSRWMFPVAAKPVQVEARKSETAADYDRSEERLAA